MNHDDKEFLVRGELNKTARVWQALIPPRGDYLAIRKQLFAHKDAATLDREIAEFNRG